MQQRIIARGNGHDGEAPDARPGKDGFRDDGTGKERAELQTKNGGDGDQRITQSVAQKDRRGRKALGAGRAHVITGEFFEHGAAHHARQDRGQGGTERNGWQDVVQSATTTGHREPAEFDRERE